MTIGSCSCEIRKDGSPCKHQYMLWTAKRAKCFNFVRINSPEDRQKLAKIAIGEALPLSYYIFLRDPNPTEFYATPVLVPNNFGANSLEKKRMVKKIKVQPNRKRKHASGSHQ